jgi:hypothetical protein
MSLGKHKLTKVFSSIINVIPQINIHSRMMILADVNEYVSKLENKIQDLEKRIITIEHTNLITKQTHIQYTNSKIGSNSNKY